MSKEKLLKVVIDELQNGQSVLVCDKAQLDELKDIFGRVLICTYDNEDDVWDCRLKDSYLYRASKGVGPKRIESASIENILKLRKEGLNARAIGRELNCSYPTVYRRLAEHKTFSKCKVLELLEEAQQMLDRDLNSKTVERIDDLLSEIYNIIKGGE